MTTVTGSPERVGGWSVNFALRAMPPPFLFHTPLIHGETMIVHVPVMLRAVAGSALVIPGGNALNPGSQFWRAVMGLKRAGDGGSQRRGGMATKAIVPSPDLPPGVSSSQGKDVWWTSRTLRSPTPQGIAGSANPGSNPHLTP